MWSSSTALNNTASKQRGTTKPFREVKDVQRPNEISHAFQSILAMPEYNNKVCNFYFWFIRLVGY